MFTPSNPLQLNKPQKIETSSEPRSFSSRIKTLQAHPFRMRNLPQKYKPNPCCSKTLRKIRQEGESVTQAIMKPATLPSVKALTFSAILLVASTAAAQTAPD